MADPKQDPWRAACRPPAGCRQCGTPPEGRRTVYCSKPCQEQYDADHFWDDARYAALQRARVFSIDRPVNPRTGRRNAVVLGRACARCGELDAREVNHIQPVNGDRRYFSCQHHQSNLEALCHECHVATTNEQRRLGLIGPAARKAG